MIKDSDELVKSGDLKDIFYGFRPSVIKEHKPLYLTLIAVVIYSIAFQIFMPYLIIYMMQYMHFNTIEYSIVFGGAIVAGAIINVFLGRYSDTKNKAKLLYVAAAIMSVGLFGMYFAKGMSHMANLILFGIAGFVMITGYIFVTALCGSMVRDHTPEGAVGKLQGVRMVFSVLIPMIVGPMIGNAINKAAGNLLENPGADAMTTSYIPAPEIFLVGAIATLLIFLVIPFLTKTKKENSAE
jgi:MFS family permease